MTEGDRVVLRTRPLTGHGEITLLADTGQWKIQLDDGTVMWVDEDDLLPELGDRVEGRDG